MLHVTRSSALAATLAIAFYANGSALAASEFRIVDWNASGCGYNRGNDIAVGEFVLEKVDAFDANVVTLQEITYRTFRHLEQQLSGPGRGGWTCHFQNFGSDFNTICVKGVATGFRGKRLQGERWGPLIDWWGFTQLEYAGTTITNVHTRGHWAEQHVSEIHSEVDRGIVAGDFNHTDPGGAWYQTDLDLEPTRWDIEKIDHVFSVEPPLEVWGDAQELGGSNHRILLARIAYTQELVPCDAFRAQAIARYASCRFDAMARALASGDPPDYSPCDEELAGRVGGSGRGPGTPACLAEQDIPRIQGAIVRQTSALGLARIARPLPPQCPPEYANRTGSGVVADLQAAILAGDTGLVACSYHDDAVLIDDADVVVGSLAIAARLASSRGSSGALAPELVDLDEHGDLVRAVYRVQSGAGRADEVVDSLLIDGGRIRGQTRYVTPALPGRSLERRRDLAAGPASGRITRGPARRPGLASIPGRPPVTYVDCLDSGFRQIEP